MLSFFKKLFIFVYGALGLPCCVWVSLSAVSRAAFCCSAWASQVVTSETTAQAVGAWAPVAVACGLSYSEACGILVPDQGLNPCIGR